MGTESRLLRALKGRGWHTGTPMTFGFSATTLNAPGNGQRANMTSLPAIFHNVGSGQKWFDVTVFSAPATATFGNGGRNIIGGPGFINLDLAVFKRFPISERYNVELRMESFNFTNTPHFNNPGATFGGSGFGEVTSAFEERQFQFGLKLTF